MILLLLQAAPHNEITFQFRNWLSVAIIAFWLVGFPIIVSIAMILLRRTQKKIIGKLNQMVTKEELTETFEAFRQELKSGK